MSRRTCVVIASAVAALAGACAGNECPPAAKPAEGAAATPAGPPDQLSIRLRDHEAEVCACKTLDCTTTAEDELASWVEDRRDLVERAFGDALREVQIEGVMARVDACKLALADAASPEDREAWRTGGGAADPAIAKMGRLADELCECADMTCAEGVMKKMSSMKEPSGTPSKAQMEKAMRIAERMAECQKELMLEDMPPPPPPPPRPPPPSPRW